MVTIVAGSPGCQEHLSPGPPPAAITAEFIHEYGYGHLEVHNATHLFWSWEQTGTAASASSIMERPGRSRAYLADPSIGDGTADIKDTVWIIKHTH